MKGLVIKDLMCLRKQGIVFMYVVIATVVLAVMFVLSSQFGNIYIGNQQMIAESQLSGVDIKNLSSMMLDFFMMLPIALVGDVATIFLYDGKAGFGNVSATLPLPIYKRVMAKYLTVLMMFGIGVGVDLVISFVLTLLTDIVTFTDFLGIILSFASVMSIYGSLTILFCLVLGYGKESYAQLASLFVMGVAAVTVNIKKINLFISATDGDASLGVVNDLIEFIKHRFYILLVIAAVTMFLSYLGAVIAAKRKRGMI